MNKIVKVVGDTTLVELTQGYFAKVDTADKDLVIGHSWCIQQYKDKAKHGATKIYAKSSIRGTQITLHRFLLNPPKDLLVDHINGDPLDNRRSNLRLTTRQGNAANRPKDRVIKSTSKYKGVRLVKSTLKWAASIYVNGIGVHLGVFTDETQAAKAYNKAALQYFGEFAMLNVV